MRLALLHRVVEKLARAHVAARARHAVGKLLRRVRARVLRLLQLLRARLHLLRLHVLRGRRAATAGHGTPGGVYGAVRDGAACAKGHACIDHTW